MEYIVIFLFVWFTIFVTLERKMPFMSRMNVIMMVAYSPHAFSVTCGLYIMVEEILPAGAFGFDMSSGPDWIPFCIGIFFIYIPIKVLYFDE